MKIQGVEKIMLDCKHTKPKFMIPKKKCKVIHRDEVLGRMDNTLNTKLTVISAPAGSGKTTAVISWIYSRNLHDTIIWISLDEKDDSPEIFWGCFISAIKAFSSKNLKDGNLTYLTSQDFSIESVISALLDTISLISKDLICVVDGFQFIKNKDILAGIKHFIDSAPDNVHTIIISRTKPNINISKLRLEGNVTEIYGKELSFTLDETSQFLKENLEAGITKESIKVLNECTEGWVAGLQIAVLSLKEKGNVIDIVERFQGDNKYVQDYFAEEVFNKEPEEIKSFLLKTCILDELTTDICNAVSCKKNSQQILEKIYDENLFTENIDYDRKVFRYHKLFKEFLINKAKGTDRDEFYESCNRAAKWYEENGLINNAVNQYVKIENFRQAEKLIEEECVNKVFSNEYFYVMYWLENMPQDIILNNPRFCITYMYIHIYDDICYHKYLEFAEKSLEVCTDKDYKRECLGILLIIKGDRNLIKSEYEKSVKDYKNALEYIGNSMFWNTIIALKLAIAYFYSQNFALEEKQVNDTLLLTQSYKDYDFNLVVNRAIVLTKLMRGQLNECENICNICLSVGASGEYKRPSLVAIFYIVLALVYYEKNETNRAEEYVLKGIKFAEKGGEFNVHHYTLCLGYYVYEAILMEKGEKGKISRINKVIGELSQRYDDNKLMDRYHFNKLKDYFQIFKLEKFLEYGKSEIEDKCVIAMNFKIKGEFVAFAKMLIYKGKFDDALMLLNKVLTSEEGRYNKYLSIRAYIYRAEILCQKDQYENATRDLREALDIGYSNGFIRIFLFKQVKMSKILIKTIKAMKFNKNYFKMGEYLNRILALYSTKEDSIIISKREREVLMLIEKGAKNLEIAQKLFISESTAKSHILNIFSKLGVRNRIQAVAKAKEIGVI